MCNSRAQLLFLLVVVASAAGNPDGMPAAAAFVRDAPLSSRPRRTLSSMHLSSSSAWGEVFQNAIGSLDRRLDIKDEIMERRRRRDVINEKNNNRHIQFVSPLLEDGYPPAVLEYEESNRYVIRRKPMLLYLPGFDGTILAPFLQFPSLGEEFDVRAMKVDMEDRSSFEELKEAVIQYLLRECRGEDGRAEDGESRGVYLMGESFGGVLATEIALELNRPAYKDYLDLCGLVLVNPATSYLRSPLYELGPPVANAQSLFPALKDIQYVFALLTKLVPMFLDEGRAMQQLIAILTSKGLPSVINDPQREAYMGRVAFDLPSRLKFMPKETLKWRLEEWLEWGCGVFEDRLEMLQSARASTDEASGDVDTYALLKVSQELRTMIVVGELDLTLPSLEEADRLSSEVFRNAYVHVVPGAGHASTCGGSLNLVELLREVFPETNMYGRIENSYAGKPTEELHGLEPRYDRAWIGLSPLLYWSKDYYLKWRRDQ
jgi:pimeloyl-ACP methyl ester carboxylesterase